jgi:hypothetical protein
MCTTSELPNHILNPVIILRNTGFKFQKLYILPKVYI